LRTINNGGSRLEISCTVKILVHTYFIHFFSLFFIIIFLLDSDGSHGSHYDSHGSLARMLVKLSSFQVRQVELSVDTEKQNTGERSLSTLLARL